MNLGKPKRLLFLTLQLAAVAGLAQRNEIYTPAERGLYAGNSRIGVWEYRDKPSEVSLRVDYTNNELVYIKSDTSDFFIKQDDKWIKSKLEIPCRFHGSAIVLSDHYDSYFAGVLPELIARDKIVKAVLTFEVGEDGIANNPEILDDPDYAVKDILLKAFASAPNYWVVGITAEGQPVKCKMAIRFVACPGTCPEIDASTPDNAKLLHDIRVMTYASGNAVLARAAPSLGITNEGLGIQFSPDDKKIIIEVEEINKAGIKPLVNGRLFVMDIEKGGVKLLPFASIQGSTWLDNERIIFKYSYSSWRYRAGVFNHVTDEITHRSDSASFFHIVSGQNRKIAFAVNDDQGITIWQLSPELNKKEPVLRNLKIHSIPHQWSPDETKLLLIEREHGFEKLVVFDLEKKQRKIVPLFNTSFIGWSLDGGSILLQKTKIGDYNTFNEIFQYDINSNQVFPVIKKLKNLYDVSFSPVTNKLALNIGGDIYLVTLGSLSEPELLFESAALDIASSNNGKMIAYIHKKDKQLYVYDIESGK